jgi:hypothetical protein
MPTIQEIRAQYPQYSDLPDQDLADALHRKYYSDMDVKDFYGRVGLSQEPQGLIENVKADIGKRNQNIEKIQDRATRNEIGPIRSGVRQAGQTAGAYLDVTGEVLSEFVPDFVKKGVGKAIETAGKLPSFGGGTIGQEIPKELEMLKEKYPEAAEDIEAVFNIGMIAAPLKSKPKVKTGVTVFGRAGDKIVRVGDKQAANQRSKFIEELVRPKQTASVKEAQVSRTSGGGLLQNKKIIPSKDEIEIASELSKIPLVNKRKTLQGNYNVVQTEVGKEADNLKNMLARNDVYFPRKEIRSALKNASANLQKSPLITGDAATSADRILAKMDELIDDMPKSSASNLLEARKKLDRWVKQQKGGDIFDPSRESAISLALREIRQTTNDFIDAKAKNVPVKQSLKRQSNLYKAMDNIAPKAAEEAPNAIARIVQNTIKHVPLKNELYQTIGAGFGAVGAGTVATAFPKVVLGGAAAYGVGKAAMSPKAKKALGELLKATDKTIRISKDKDLIRQLRADRAILLEVLKTAPSASVQNQSTRQQENLQQKQE